MIFVAQPYYHFDDNVIKERVRYGAHYCAALLNQNVMCISPVMFGTPILDHAELPADFSFWDKISLTLLDKCDVMHVLTILGWDKSRGVKAEMEMAQKLGMPIKYITIEDLQKEIEKSKIKIHKL